MPEKKKDEPIPEANSNAGQVQTPAVPPPDDPLRRAQEFDPDREQKSREMAEKRLAAIRKTRQMPTATDEAVERESEETPSQADSDST